jgi:Cu-processing system permease protein
MGLAAINLIGVIIAIFVGISLVNKEIERRTIYTIMARPISRSLFSSWASTFGLALTLFVNMAIMLGGVSSDPVALPCVDSSASIFQAVALDLRGNFGGDGHCPLFFDVHIDDVERHLHAWACM